MTDFLLAISHHLLIFAIFGIIAAELVLVRPGIDAAGVRRVAKIDIFYGTCAGFVVLAGFSRAIFAAKGWPYYSHNGFFWAKMATFAAVGILSVPPTLAFLRWQKTGASPTDAQIAGVRSFLYLETGLFALLPIFAAAMARGYGEF